MSIADCERPTSTSTSRLAGTSSVGDAEVRRLEAIARALPLPFTAPTIERLERVPLRRRAPDRGPGALSLRQWKPTPPRDGRTSFLGGTTPSTCRDSRPCRDVCAPAISQCRPRAPSSHAGYDLTSPAVLESEAWLAVRHTAWSDRVRPQFRNTRRTMFRELPPRVTGRAAVSTQRCREMTALFVIRTSLRPPVGDEPDRHAGQHARDPERRADHAELSAGGMRAAAAKNAM